MFSVISTSDGLELSTTTENGAACPLWLFAADPTAVIEIGSPSGSLAGGIKATVVVDEL